MQHQFDQQSNSYQHSSQSQESQRGQRFGVTITHNQTSLQRLISLNVTIFNDLGFSVSADNFQCQANSQDDQDALGDDNSSDQSGIDYGDSQQDESDPAVQADLSQEEQNYQINGQQINHQGLAWNNDNFSVEESNEESPFFPSIQRQEGLTIQEINRVPTMRWSVAHNIFNKGEKCPVCLEEFQLGHILRVTQCLHRFHVQCIDQWLMVKSSCPSCRNPSKRQLNQ